MSKEKKRINPDLCMFTIARLAEEIQLATRTLEDVGYHLREPERIKSAISTLEETASIIKEAVKYVPLTCPTFEEGRELESYAEELLNNVIYLKEFIKDKDVLSKEEYYQAIAYWGNSSARLEDIMIAIRNAFRMK